VTSGDRSTHPKKLQERSIIVYGASAPIGAGIALALSREGANVVVHYRRNRASADEIVAGIQTAGAHAIALSADVTDDVEVAALLDRATAHFGSVDGVVNCVHGPFEPRLVAEHTWDDWRVHLDALKGHVVICKSVLPIMRKQGGGRIVFISGGLSHRLFEGFSAFSTVKAGLNAFSKTLALEEGKHQITVNIVAPGKVETDLQVTTNSAAWIEIEHRQRVAAPLLRYATIRDVAGAVLYFLSPEASGITGQTLFVASGEVMF
jgi:3-oxoacyl-[acyl-carrier protein] reductase